MSSFPFAPFRATSEIEKASILDERPTHHHLHWHFLTEPCLKSRPRISERHTARWPPNKFVRSNTLELDAHLGISEGAARQPNNRCGKIIEYIEHNRSIPMGNGNRASFRDFRNNDSRASYGSAPINDGIGGSGEFAVVRASKRIREMEIYGDEEYRAGLKGSSQVV